MKLSGHTRGSSHLDPFEAMDFFARVGLDAVELICDLCAVTHQISPLMCKELRSRAEAAGIAA